MQAAIWRKIESSLFTGKSGKIMRQDYASFALAAYLISCQQSNQIGIFSFEPSVECTRFGMTPEKCQEALALCIESGFCQFDPEAELIYIPNYTLIQVGELKERDNRRRTLQNALAATPEHEFMKEWIKKYQGVYGEKSTTKKESPTTTKGVTDPSTTTTQAVPKGSGKPSQPKKEEPKQEDNYPGEHVMGQLTEEEKAAGYEAQRLWGEEQRAKQEERKAKALASIEAKKTEGVHNPSPTTTITLDDPFDTIDQPLPTTTEPITNPSPTLTEDLAEGSGTVTARERKEKTREEKKREEELSKDNSDSLILQTGNQLGGTLLAGAPGLPSQEQTAGDLARVVAELERLGIDDDLEDAARWVADFTGKKLASVAIVLSALPYQFDPHSEEARAVRGNIKPWQGWIAGNLPGDL